MIPHEIIIEKIPALTCKKCGGFKVMMTDNGPECEMCDAKPQQVMKFSEELDYLLYQIEPKEQNNEAF